MAVAGYQTPKQLAALSERSLLRPLGSVRSLRQSSPSVSGNRYNAAQRSVVVLKAAAADATEGRPANWVEYETMLVLKPTLTDEERDRELARFEAFLAREDAKDLHCTVRGRQRMAYQMRGHQEGIYVLYTYTAGRSTSQKVQKLLSTPDAGAEDNILRHMTFAV